VYIVGEEEIEAIARVIRWGKLFRYGEGGQCATFEKRESLTEKGPIPRFCGEPLSDRRLRDCASPNHRV
jgi:hypothetical protein